MMITDFFIAVSSGINSMFNVVIGGLNLRSAVLSVFIVSCVLRLVRSKASN